MKMIKSIITGIVSGMVLGLFLKMVESLTNHKVYTLLLNVDYVPILNQMKLHESIEFSLHLLISILLSIFLVWILADKYWKITTKFSFVMITSLLIGLLLYPTTTLSSRTPELTDLAALSFWMIGHALYGFVLAFLLKNKNLLS